MRIGNRIQAFERYNFQWPWVTPNPISMSRQLMLNSSETVRDRDVVRIDLMSHDLEWFIKIFSDTNHCAASLRQLSYLQRTNVTPTLLPEIRSLETRKINIIFSCDGSYHKVGYGANTAFWLQQQAVVVSAVVDSSEWENDESTTCAGVECRPKISISCQATDETSPVSAAAAAAFTAALRLPYEFFSCRCPNCHSVHPWAARKEKVVWDLMGQIHML